MKRTLISVLCVFAFWNAWTQKPMLTNFVTGESQVNIALEEVKKTFTPPLNQVNQLKSGEQMQTDIRISYVDFPEDAKRAFEYAASIWARQISSPVPINILARWESIDGGVIALSRPAGFYKNFDGAQVEDVYYPVTLVEKLSGREWNAKSEPDIICQFNSKSSWYFGVDGNTPQTQYDFVSAVLHEITHGLGFSGFFQVENNTGFFNNVNNEPSIYDYYIFNKNNQRLSDKTNFNSPSAELENQLTSQNLKYSKNNESINGFKVYAPDSWRKGASLYHLNEDEFKSGEENALMTAYAYKGEAIHYPGKETLEILNGLGWKSISFQFKELKDIENASAELPVNITVLGEILDSSSVKMVYSSNLFASKDSVYFSYNGSENKFSGNISINNFTGKLQYYFEACSKQNEIFRFPANAPAKKLALRVGPDYFPPIVKHNPVKIISADSKTIELTGVVEDNIGVEAVKVEYRVNGISHDPIDMEFDADGCFVSKVQISETFSKNNIIEYRIVANDISKNGNKIASPKSGFYNVEVFEPVIPVTSYSSDFNSINNDFIQADFAVSEISGFSDGVLHTAHPYPVSALENENYNLIAQLKYPVIIEENGTMSFDEVVLVEPGEEETTFNNSFFWDYVIVEGSNNNGKTWTPISEGYDSGIDDLWYSEFMGSLNGNKSLASGHENQFLNRTLNITENTGFSVGDTVLFRFRLSSDNTVSGWGWAIDNLKIQDLNTEMDEFGSDELVNVYPNPFLNDFVVDCSNMNNNSTVNVVVTDLMGKIIHNEMWTNKQNNSRKQVNLPGLKSGIYLVNMVVDASQIITKKLVKN